MVGTDNQSYDNCSGGPDAVILVETTLRKARGIRACGFAKRWNAAAAVFAHTSINKHTPDALGTHEAVAEAILLAHSAAGQRHQQLPGWRPKRPKTTRYRPSTIYQDGCY